ncbi:MAG: hypothetical protein P9M14_06090 [Candidatus Alcyoniella australis]|nr:hypothetical protein [Candidatus Alcyoniella australis]
MIKAALQDALSCFAIGQLIAWLASHGLSEPDAPGRRELGWTLLFAALGWVPVSLYFLLVHPAWSWAYAVADSPINWNLVVFALTAQVGLLLLGYFWSCELLRGGSIWAPLMFAVSCAIYVLSLIAPGDVLHLFGTLEQFQAGQAVPIWRCWRLMIELAVSGVWLVAWLLVVRRRIRD